MYLKIANHLNKKRDSINFDIDDIQLIPYLSPLVIMLKSAISTGSGISGIRFQNNVINGQLIEDAFIYRME